MLTNNDKFRKSTKALTIGLLRYIIVNFSNLSTRLL